MVPADETHPRSDPCAISLLRVRVPAVYSAGGKDYPFWRGELELLGTRVRFYPRRSPLVGFLLRLLGASDPRPKLDLDLSNLSDVSVVQQKALLRFTVPRYRLEFVGNGASHRLGIEDGPLWYGLLTEESGGKYSG